MEELKYIIEESTIAKLLGIQNFSTDEAAILELVKNAYDAKAVNLIIDFNRDSLLFLDDGEGMNDQDIRDYWMHIGKSNKKYEIVDSNNVSRVQAGSKGVGRFALARLGEEVEIWSKKKNNTGIVWRTNWNKSTLEETTTLPECGTTIIIHHLREKWNELRIQNLAKYLERTYNDTSMKITVRLIDKGIVWDVPVHFPEAKVGINCKSNIILEYNKGILSTKVLSDEFLDEATKYCENINIQYYCIKTNMEDELKGNDMPEIDDELLGEQLKKIGPFSANLFFNFISTKNDNERFLYKHSKTPVIVEEGIILYRNAFSISSYDGKKDWLGLGKRSRKSPAAASHPTGAWRVRENQLSGYVQIDKKRNEVLRDLANRQGLEENAYYQLFVEIILTGIKEFERYRQKIIRMINSKNSSPEEKPTPFLHKVMRNPLSIKQLSDVEIGKLINEIKAIQKEGEQAIKEKNDVGERYRYDVRILNVLATTGLKASSIAHEMRNDRNDLSEIYDNVIESLKEYGMWDELNEPGHMKKIYRNVPYMLKRNQDVSKKLIAFMNTMLAEIEKKQFDIKKQNIRELTMRIIKSWQRDYGCIKINTRIDPLLEYTVSEDIMQVVLDNMILNSIQQNEKKTNLRIDINIEKDEGMLFVNYHDNGRGLDKKYANNPMKILEVHETTRKNGHGLGMWIVNNTVSMSGGTIKEIKGDTGFEISLTIGDDYVE